MAHLLVRQDDTECWGVLELDGEPVVLTSDVTRPLRKRQGSEDAGSGLILGGTRHGDHEVWTLLVSRASEATVNGTPLLSGMRVLRDRDEIIVGGTDRLYFSTERLARVEPFPGADQPIVCPRCKQEIEKGMSSVRCPGCGILHHQTEKLPCWTYNKFCTMCDQTTSLDGGFRWTPEDV